MPNNKHTYIAFDFGTKRIGMAVGQTITQSATPLPLVHVINGEPTWEQIDKAMTKWQPCAIVIGIPVNMDGTEQHTTHLARGFANQLKARYKLPVHRVDERLTTATVKEEIFTRGGFKALQKANIDSYAAKLILESWFMNEEKSQNT